jgi:hypothetical protein
LDFVLENDLAIEDLLLVPQYLLQYMERGILRRNMLVALDVRDS